MLASERVEGDADGGLFALVDELTGKLRGRLETRAARLMDHGRKLEDVTTYSIEAYKAYAEGSRLHDRLQERDAQGYFEKAVQFDPGFAMALAKLSVVHANLENIDKAREYSDRALEKAGNLPPGERYYIEGRHYSLDPATADKAIAAYHKAVDEAPDHTSARNNLAQMLIEQHRYPEALVHLEELRRRGMSFPGTWMSLAEAYSATGQPDRGREALETYVRDHPDRSAGYENLGLFELVQGRLDPALAAFDRAGALQPDQRTKVEFGRFVVAALQDRWKDAEAAADALTKSDDPRDRWSGGEGRAIASLYRGDVGEARRIAEEGATRAGTTEERPGRASSAPASRWSSAATTTVSPRPSARSPTRAATASRRPKARSSARSASRRWASASRRRRAPAQPRRSSRRSATRAPRTATRAAARRDGARAGRRRGGEATPREGGGAAGVEEDRPQLPAGGDPVRPRPRGPCRRRHGRGSAQPRERDRVGAVARARADPVRAQPGPPRLPRRQGGSAGRGPEALRAVPALLEGGRHRPGRGRAGGQAVRRALQAGRRLRARVSFASAALLAAAIS